MGIHFRCLIGFYTRSARDFNRFARDFADIVNRADNVKDLAELCSEVARRHSNDTLQRWLNSPLPEAAARKLCGLTPLMMCVKMKRVYCARYVVEECGADPNVKSHCRNKTTALNLACYLGLADVVTMLLDHGGDPNIMNRQVYHVFIQYHFLVAA